jgi:glycosyltransferase involved in cell wall biosynthesis
MPVALDRFTEPTGDKFLHVGGHKARGDRNGTETAIRASRKAQIPLTVTTQDRVRMAGRGVTQPRSVPDYWRLYDGHGVLVMPRRYGGLSLVVQEAMAAGLAVIMPDCSPNQDWPVSLVGGRWTHTIKMAGGDIPFYDLDLTALIDEMRRMLDLNYRAEWQAKSREWASANSWRNCANVC